MNKALVYIFSMVVFSLSGQTFDFELEKESTDTSLVNSIFYNPQEDAFSPVLFGVNSGADQYSLSYVGNDYSWTSRLLSMDYNQLNFRNDTTPFFEGRYDYGSDYAHWFGADFSRNIGESKIILNFNRNYTEDIYSNTEVERSNFVVGSKIKLAKRYVVDVGYFRNGVNKSESGGVKNIVAYTEADELNIFTVDPNLTSAKNEVFNNGFILNQQIFLIGGKDSIGNNKAELTLGINSKVEEHRFTFSMSEADIDSGYFTYSYLDTTSTFDSIGFQKVIINPELTWKNKFRTKGVKIGYSKEMYDNTLLDRSNIQMKSFLHFKKNTFRLAGEYSLQSYWKDNYSFGFNFQRDSIQSSKLNVEFKTSSIIPEYLFHVFNGNHFQWNNVIKPVNTQSLDLKWLNSKYKLIVNGKISQVSNYLYFDSLSSVKQEGNSVIVFKANLTHNYRYKWLQFTSSFTGQYSNTDAIRIPSFYSRNTLSLNMKARNVPLSLGTVFTYVSEFKGIKYNPAIRHYILGSQSIGNLPILDLFFVARVGTADLYLRYENLLFNTLGRDMFVGDNSPLAKPFLRFGLKWKLLN